ncbi:MAG: hypothetical protein RLZZ579_1114 [Actinomycetota bacterium]
MGLSEQEKKLLEELERNLMSEDKDFESRVRAVDSTNKSAGKLVAGVLIMLVGLGLMVFAVMLQVAFFGVAAFLVMLVGLVIASANFRLPELKLEAPTAGPDRKNYFEDRWDRRFGDQ